MPLPYGAVLMIGMTLMVGAALESTAFTTGLKAAEDEALAVWIGY